MKKTLMLIYCLATLSVFSQDAESLIAHYSLNFGGENRMMTLKSVVMEGIYKTGEVSAPMTVTIIQDKLYHKEYTVKGAKNFQTITPLQGGYSFPSEGVKEVVEYNPEELESLKAKTYLMGELIYAQKNHRPINYEGTQDIGGISYHVISLMVGPPPASKKIYLNSQNFFIDKETQVYLNNQGQEVEETTYYSDYQKNPEGYIFPMNIKDPKGEFIVKSVKVNPEIDFSKLNIKYPLK